MPKKHEDEHDTHFVKSVARKRWRILAKALLKSDADDITDVSVRRFTSFGILSPIPIDEQWCQYSTTDNKYSLNVRRLSDSLTANDLMGFNNTGNICIWPSEETLSIYITSNLYIFENKTVLELGGGMSCMAGLILAKYGLPSHVNVTDGNLKSIENVKYILKNNSLETKASCSVLQWQSIAKNKIKYDIILVADCLFFDEVREDLIRTIHIHLSDKGTAFVMAPQRGDTLDQFISTSKSFGFDCVKVERYNDLIWERHLQLLNTNEYYDPSLHYPILLKMTKTSADYWKSNDRKYCDFCKCWIADNKISISLHEDGRRHKDNVTKKISAINKQSAKDHKEKTKMDAQLAKMEKVAMAAYMKDIESNADLTSQIINEKLAESRKNKYEGRYTGGCSSASSSNVGPTSSKKTTWQEARSEDGQVYYWNTESNEASWDPPSEGYVSLADLVVKEKNTKQQHQNNQRKPPKPPKKGKNFKNNKKKFVMPDKPKIVKPKETFDYLSRGGNLYGDWAPVVQASAVDLQLPQQTKPTVDAPIVIEKIVERQFKEKQLTSIAEDDSSVSTFKKRKINNNAKRNTRQRLDDD